MPSPYDVTDSSNLESLFSNLNQVTMRESRGGGGTGGGSLPIEGNMDSNPLIAHNPYLGKNVTSFNDGGEFEYSEDLYEAPPGYFQGDPYEADRINKLRRKEWMEHVGLNPYHVQFNSADKSDYRKLYEAEQERRKEESTKWRMRENYDMQGSYKEDPEYIKWKEGSDNIDNLTNPWEEGYDDWYKPRATADSEGDTKPSSGSGGGRTTPSAARRNKKDVLNQIISSNQVASQGKSKGKSGTMDLAHWAGDKPNPYLTLNIQEETDYAAKGMKMPKYNQGGHYTQQANEAVAANQLSNILMNSSSLSSGIMPMAKYDKGGKVVLPWENQDWIDSKDFENWGGLPNPPLTPMQQHMSNVMLDPSYTPPSDFNIDFSPKTRSNPMAEMMQAALDGNVTEEMIEAYHSRSKGAPSWWDIPTDGETKDNKKKAKLSGGSSNNRLSTSRNKKQNRINNIIHANQQAQKRKSGSGKMDLAHWSGDKPNPFLTLNVQSETDYANKGMKMNNLSNKERLQNLLKAVPNEAAFNKLSKTDQENFTKSWIRLGGVKKRKFTQGGRF